MPIYEYICDDCGHEFEVLIRGAEQPVCPSCGQSRLTKQLSVPAAHVAAPAASSCPAAGFLRREALLRRQLRDG